MNKPMETRVVILDISANNHKNDKEVFKKMIDDVAALDKNNRVIFKGQLWEGKMGENIEQNKLLFAEMVTYAWKEHQRKLTASVFDKYSLGILMSIWQNLELTRGVNIPFIKIANRRDLDNLTGTIPRNIPIVRSTDRFTFGQNGHIGNCTDMLCVSRYPATLEDYAREITIAQESGSVLGAHRMSTHISDHTIGLKLWRFFHPVMWEKHLKLKDSTGLDAGPFAITPNELEEVLN